MPSLRGTKNIQGRETTMKIPKKFLWGGLGALLPIISSIAIADADTIAGYLSKTENMAIAGYVVKILFLFVVGGMWVYISRTENDPAKLIQLGIVAPAMLTVWISSATVVEQREQATLAPVRAVVTFVSSHNTGSTKPSPWDNFIKGVLGRP